MRLIYCHCRIVTEATKYIQVSRWLRSRSRRYFKFQFENQNHHHYFQNQNHHHFKNKSHHLYSQNQNTFLSSSRCRDTVLQVRGSMLAVPNYYLLKCRSLNSTCCCRLKIIFFYKLKTVFKEIFPPCKILRAIWI